MAKKNLLGMRSLNPADPTTSRTSKKSTTSSRSTTCIATRGRQPGGNVKPQRKQGSKKHNRETGRDPRTTAALRAGNPQSATIQGTLVPRPADPRAAPRATPRAAAHPRAAPRVTSKAFDQRLHNNQRLRALKNEKIITHQLVAARLGGNTSNVRPWNTSTSGCEPWKKLCTYCSPILRAARPTYCVLPMHLNAEKEKQLSKHTATERPGCSKGIGLQK